MYIKLENIKDEVTIDVRSKEEFEKMPLFKYNIPVIDEKEHKLLKKYIMIAFPIILIGLIKNRRIIREDLLRLSNNKEKTIVIGCSQGRLRSPIVAFYSRCLGIDTKILEGGIKQYYKPVEKGIKKWFSI